MNKKLILSALIFSSGMALLTNHQAYSHWGRHGGFHGRMHCGMRVPGFSAKVAVHGHGIHHHRAPVVPQAAPRVSVVSHVHHRCEHRTPVVIHHHHHVRHCHRAPQPMVVHRCGRPAVAAHVGFHGPRVGIGFGCGGMSMGFGFRLGGHCHGHWRHR